MRESFHCNASRTGLTLVEVVVSLVLLASLLVGMINAYGNHHRQLLRTDQRLQAIDAADHLIAGWYERSEPRVPRRDEGLLRGSSALIWRTVPIQRTTIEGLPVEIIRLQVFSARRTAEEHVALAQVDLLVSAEETIR